MTRAGARRQLHLTVAAAVIASAGVASAVYAGAHHVRPLTPDQPVALASSRDGDLYIADSGRNQILDWRPSRGFRIVAGTGRAGLTGDGEPARRAEIDSPQSLVIAPDGTLSFVQAGRRRAPASAGGMLNAVIREITPAGTMRTIAGLRPSCPPGPLRSIPAESALFYGASLSLSPGGALTVDTSVCVGRARTPGPPSHLLLTASGRFVANTSNLVPRVAWQAVDCGTGVAGPGFHAFACASGLRHPKQLLVVRRDGAAATYAAYRRTEFAVGGGEVVATYDDSLVRVTRGRLVPLLTHDELLGALHTRLIWDVFAPTLDARGDIYFAASIESPSRSGCRSLILERTARGTTRRLWASPAAQKRVCT